MLSFEPIQCCLLSLGADMRRASSLCLFGGVAAWPLAARGQRPAMPVIGYMSARAPDDSTHLTAAFLRLVWPRAATSRAKNPVHRVSMGARSIRSAAPALAADLVNLRVSVLVAVGGDPSPRRGHSRPHVDHSDCVWSRRRSGKRGTPARASTGREATQPGLIQSYTNIMEAQASRNC